MRIRSGFRGNGSGRSRSVASIDDRETQTVLRKSRPAAKTAWPATTTCTSASVVSQLAVARADLAGLVAWMMALCMPSAAWLLNRTVAFVKPAAVRSCRQRYVLDGAPKELDIAGAGPRGVGRRKVEHLIGHVDAVGEPGLADSTSRQQLRRAPARAEVQHLLTLPELRHGDGPAAARLAATADRETVPVRRCIKCTAEGVVDLQDGRAATPPSPQLSSQHENGQVHGSPW